MDSLAAQLDAVFDGASGDRQWGAAGSAAAIKAKLLGLMKDRLEVSGGGMFGDCSTPDQVIDKLVADEGGDPRKVIEDLQAIITMLEARAGSMAIDITPEPSRPRPSESERALQLLRPGKKH